MTVAELFRVTRANHTTKEDTPPPPPPPSPPVLDKIPICIACLKIIAVVDPTIVTESPSTLPGSLKWLSFYDVKVNLPPLVRVLARLFRHPLEGASIHSPALLPSTLSQRLKK